MAWRPAGKSFEALATPVCTCKAWISPSRGTRRQFSSAVAHETRPGQQELGRQAQWLIAGRDHLPSSRTGLRNGHGEDAIAGRRTYITAAASATSTTGGGGGATPPRVAVIGAGLSGLTTAYYLALKLPPQSKIVVYEGSDRVGGWLWSERVSVDVNGAVGKVLVERGPRLLSTARSFSRNDRLVLYDLMMSHGLMAVATKPTSRYIWHDSDSRLLELPSSDILYSLLREPVFWATGVPSIVRYALKWLTKTPKSFPQEDMSVGEWLLTVTGSRSLVDDIASAGMHGVWGGDIYQLSAASVLGWLFQRAKHPAVRSRDDVIPATERDFVERFLSEHPETEYMWRRQGPPLLSFGRHGLESLPIAIADSLKSSPNVEIKLNNRVQGLNYDPSGNQIIVKDGKQKLEKFDKVVSTLSSQHLARLTDNKLPSLKNGHSVSIMAVNLWYPFRDLVPPGLGYLIPISVPPERNPERALGVFLDSEVDIGSDPDAGYKEPGTKLFVLLGGHYYDRPDGPEPPTEAEAIEQAKTLLERQLNIPRDMPCFATARFNRECLPQHYVGHHRRMSAASAELQSGFANRLAAIGGSYRSPGILGAARAGYDIAHSIAGANFFDNGLQAVTHEKFMNPDTTLVPQHWRAKPSRQ